jgi:hypothetical protein
VSSALAAAASKYNVGTVEVTGHSLGAALATLLAVDLERGVAVALDGDAHAQAGAPALTLQAVTTFGSPRVGDPNFVAFHAREKLAHALVLSRPQRFPHAFHTLSTRFHAFSFFCLPAGEELGVASKNTRVTHYYDIVPHVPEEVGRGLWGVSSVETKGDCLMHDARVVLRTWDSTTSPPRSGTTNRPPATRLVERLARTLTPFQNSSCSFFFFFFSPRDLLLFRVVSARCATDQARTRRARIRAAQPTARASTTTSFT